MMGGSGPQALAFLSIYGGKPHEEILKSDQRSDFESLGNLGVDHDVIHPSYTSTNKFSEQSHGE